LPCTLPPRHLHSFPTRRSSDLHAAALPLDVLRVRREIDAVVGARGAELERLVRSEDRAVAGAAHVVLGAAADVVAAHGSDAGVRSEEHTSELQSQSNLVCRLLL